MRKAVREQSDHCRVLDCLTQRGLKKEVALRLNTEAKLDEKNVYHVMLNTQRWRKAATSERHKHGVRRRMMLPRDAVRRVVGEVNDIKQKAEQTQDVRRGEQVKNVHETEKTESVFTDDFIGEALDTRKSHRGPEV